MRCAILRRSERLSLRLRLLIAAGAVALIALVVADLVTYASLRTFLYQQLDRSLGSTLASTGSGPLAPAPRPSLPSVAPGGRAGGFAGPRGPSSAGGAFVEVRDRAGALLVEHPAHSQGGAVLPPPALPSPLPSTAGGPAFFTSASTVRGGPPFRIGVGPGPAGSTVIVGLPSSGIVATLRRLFVVELLVTGAALAVALAIGWWLVRVALRPLIAMESTAGVIAGGRLDARVPSPGERTEIGRLAGALNAMLSRIEEAFAERDATELELRASEERMRRFVADASHELRTPLAAVSAYAELFSLGANVRPEDLDRVMRGIQGESARMGRLVEDLLLLARLDEGRPFARQPVELVGLVDEAVEASRMMGPAWPIAVASDRPVEILGDRERLRQVLDNLLGNVRSHTPAGTRTLVSVLEDDGHAVIEVHDEGGGLADDDAARVFDRFYRADTSRSRATGGTGLGLPIVAAIAHVHGGGVVLHTELGRGATFRVWLPTDPAAEPL